MRSRVPHNRAASPALVLVLALVWGVSACNRAVALQSPVLNPPEISTEPPASETAFPTATGTIVPSPTTLFTATPLPSPTATLDPLAHLTIQGLADRTYGGGQIEIRESLGETPTFTRYLIAYPSDGLMVYGFLNVPKGEGPFPVIIALHGYIDPAIYQTLDYTTRYADSLADAGFLVLHPNLRGYPPSDPGPNLFRVGMAVDVLNLIALVHSSGGLPGPLEAADPERVGLWGHSMGGGISLRVITVDPSVRAAVLYGSMSGDEERNFSKILEWSQGARGLEELDFPPQDRDRISPIHHLDRIQAAVSIHHGLGDELVPPAWSEELCGLLYGLQARVDCYTYPGQPHTFFGEADQLFIQRTIDFFQEHLGP